MNIYNLSKKTVYLGIAILLTSIVLFFVAIWYVVPPIPKKVVLATGATTGLYHRFGESLKTQIEKNGVKVELKSTAGSLENLKLLSEPNSGVSLALVQTGVANPDNYKNLVSISGVFYEPYWVWYRESAFKEAKVGLNSITELKGKRVAIGTKGSGSNLFSRELLKLHGIDESQISLYEISPDEALKKIKDNEIDAATFVVGVEAPIVAKYYKIPDLAIMNFDQADAYVRQLPYLSKVYLPRGNVSLEYNQPPKNIHLIAPTAVLVARDTISPGFVNLIMGELYDLLKNYSRVQEAAEFPSNSRLDLPQQGDAENYMKEGPSFLYRHLPFWLAVWVVRFLKVAIPILAIGIPVITYLPSLLSIKVNLTLGKAYIALRQLENQVLELEKSKSSINEVEKTLIDLHELEITVSKMKIPTLQSEKYFDIKSYIDILRIRLIEMIRFKN